MADHRVPNVMAARCPLARRGAVPDVRLEAPAVAALRSLGALVVGKAQMQEFGLLPTGRGALGARSGRGCGWPSLGTAVHMNAWRGQ